MCVIEAYLIPLSLFVPQTHGKASRARNDDHDTSKVGQSHKDFLKPHRSSSTRSLPLPRLVPFREPTNHTLPRAIHRARLNSLQAPEICTLYALNISPVYLRHVIRQKFERNRSVTDPKIIDVLIAKDRMEYQETMNCWKMNDQLLGIFIQGDGGKPVQGTFLQKFYQGESAVCSDYSIVYPQYPYSSFSIPGSNEILIVRASGRDEQAVRPAATGM